MKNGYYYSNAYPYQQAIPETQVPYCEPSLTTNLGKVELDGSYEVFLYETLTSLIGRVIKVQTTNGTLQGTLIGVKPDHLTIEGQGGGYYIRCAQIVWILPVK